MDFKELRRLMRLMKEFDLAEVEVEEEGRRVRLKGASSAFVSAAAGPVNAAPASSPPLMPVATAAGEAGALDAGDSGLVEIPSPTVGTFYRAPSPDDPAYVNVGDAVRADTVVCIVEAMKVMNEIKAEVEGEIVEILVNDAEAVEFGQPLFLVRPA